MTKECTCICCWSGPHRAHCERPGGPCRSCGAPYAAHSASGSPGWSTGRVRFTGRSPGGCPGSSGPPAAPSGSRPRLSLAFGPGASRPRDRGGLGLGMSSALTRHVRPRPAAPGDSESDAGQAGSESRGRDLTPPWPHWPAGPRAESEGVRRRPARRPGLPAIDRGPPGGAVPVGSRRNVSLADSESARACHTGTLAGARASVSPARLFGLTMKGTTFSEPEHRQSGTLRLLLETT
jgi:hypothetical protein